MANIIETILNVCGLRDKYQIENVFDLPHPLVSCNNVEIISMIVTYSYKNKCQLIAQYQMSLPPTFRQGEQLEQ